MVKIGKLFYTNIIIMGLVLTLTSPAGPVYALRVPANTDDLNKRLAALMQDKIPHAKHSNIKLVLFDVGQVLFEVDFNRSVEKLKEFFPDLGRKLNQETEIFIYHLFSNREKGSLGYEFERSKIGEFEFFNKFKDSLTKKGFFTDLSYNQFLEIWDAAYSAVIEENIFLFKTLIAKGYKVKILSNNNPIHKRLVISLLKKQGIDISPEYFISSHEIGMLKQESGMFKKVLTDRLDGASANSVLFIDDNLNNSIAAWNAGIWGVQYVPGMEYIEEIVGILEDAGMQSEKKLIKYVYQLKLWPEMNVSKISDFRHIVEEPVVLACMILNFKGICTTNSSANVNGINSGYAWIKIDIDCFRRQTEILL